MSPSSLFVQRLGARPRGRAAAASAALALGLVAVAPSSAQTPETHWVGTWAAGLEPGARVNPPGFVDQTLRFIVRTSIGGSSARIQLSNAFGTTPLTIGSAHLGIQRAGAAIVPGSDRALTFLGQSSVVIPPRAVVYSDPVDLPVPELANVAISLYLPGPAVTPVTGHSFSLMTNYTSPRGNFVGAEDMPVGPTGCFTIAPRPCITPWYFISRLEVMAPAGTAAVVTLGDSITDGDPGNSPVNSIDKNVRWPGFFANRLLAQKGGPSVAVLNAGISGNRILGGNGAVDRLQRDVLSQEGVKWVVLLEGINDTSDTQYIADQLIAADRQIVDRVHALGLKIYGATLTPNSSAVGGLRELNRTTLNDWIRTSGAFDAVIDFEAVMRDPARPNFMKPGYNSGPGDNTHPSPAGYEIMANSIDLGLFKGRDGPYPWSGVRGDVTGDGAVDCADLRAVRAVVGARRDQPVWAPTADIDGNGVIDIRDLSGVAKLLPAGAGC